MPAVRAWPIKLGRSPDQGHSPNLNTEVTARQSLASHPAAKPQHPSLSYISCEPSSSVLVLACLSISID